jgi:hypothetical protein
MSSMLTASSQRLSGGLAVGGAFVIAVSAVLNSGITRIAAQPAEGKGYRSVVDSTWPSEILDFHEDVTALSW